MKDYGRPGAKAYTFAGLGEILWDELPGGRRLGGAPANFAYHAHRLGARGLILSRIGRDSEGREILEYLSRAGLETEYITIDDDHPTGRVTVHLDSHGVPGYTIHENAAWDYLDLSADLLDLAGRIDAVSFGSLAQRSPVSRETVTAFLSATPRNSLRLFDVNLRQSYYTEEILKTSLHLANVLKINQEELAVLSELFRLKGPLPDKLKQLRTRFELDLVALTRGKNGSFLHTRAKDSDFPGISVAVCDTVGAGDAFGAALVLGLLKGLDLDSLNDRANRLAARVCTQCGAWWGAGETGYEMNVSIIEANKELP